MTFIYRIDLSRCIGCFCLQILRAEFIRTQSVNIYFKRNFRVESETCEYDTTDVSGVSIHHPRMLVTIMMGR